eukprot:scaffold6021_cov117-Isochrysis_galbana.AAC.17
MAEGCIFLTVCVYAKFVRGRPHALPHAKEIFLVGSGCMHRGAIGRHSYIRVTTRPPTPPSPPSPWRHRCSRRGRTWNHPSPADVWGKVHSRQRGGHSRRCMARAAVRGRGLRGGGSGQRRAAKGRTVHGSGLLRMLM